jgi:MinD superfamily P-loop ATPase
MKEIVVISGKGGTGKTSVTASFAFLTGPDTVLADCDVDASDMHLLLAPEIVSEENFLSSFLAVIDQEKCIKCGKCLEVCRFKAVELSGGDYKINSQNCEGCGYCTRVCPPNALSLKMQNDGKLFVSKTRLGKTLFHAELGPGAENSGKLVAKVKNNAKKYARENNISSVLIDGSPGIGCPVISSLSGANFVVLVTEPTVSGAHDLKRVAELVKKFKIKTGCIINKADINAGVTNEIKEYIKENNIEFLGELPYDEDFTKAMIAGKTAAEYSDKLALILREALRRINNLIEE